MFSTEDDDFVEIEDPYAFEKQITDFDCYVFGEGNHHRIFDKLGAHMMTIDGVEGTLFAVWAPDARAVSVVGDFNMWDERLHHMELHGESGIFELFIPGAWEGAKYKYEIVTRMGESLSRPIRMETTVSFDPGKCIQDHETRYLQMARRGLYEKA